LDYKPYPNLTEFRDTIDEFKENITSLDYLLEWRFAAESGWDKEEFEELYRAYVESTQIKIQPSDDKTKLKGRPLELIGRYLLEKGGIAHQIVEISDPSKWQVDGCGPVHKTAIRFSFGKKICELIGLHVYLEAKNHSDPLENSEFSDHCRRMHEHHCNFGVMISTSGYRIGRGKGISESIYVHSCKEIFHALLVFQSITAVILEQKAPLFIIQEALSYACNNMYVHDKEVQYYYSQEACKKAAMLEYERLSSL